MNHVYIFIHVKKLLCCQKKSKFCACVQVDVVNIWPRVALRAPKALKIFIGLVQFWSTFQHWSLNYLDSLGNFGSRTNNSRSWTLWTNIDFQSSFMQHPKFELHTSQWLSKNTKTSPLAAFVALILERINPSLLSFRITWTFFKTLSSSPTVLSTLLSSTKMISSISSMGVFSNTETIVRSKVDLGSSRNVIIMVVLGKALPLAKALKSFSAHFGLLKNELRNKSSLTQ